MNEYPESRSGRVTRHRWGTLFVLCAFAASTVGGLGFLFAYWTKGNNFVLGGTLALFSAGLGATLVLWAHWLMSHKQVAGPREALPSGPDERESVLASFQGAENDVERRGLLTWMSAVAIGMFAAFAVSLFKSLGPSPYPTLYNTYWKTGQRLMTEDGKPVSIDSLQPGSSIMVFPEDSVGAERTQTVLIRVKQELLQLPEERTNWAPMGYLAYSRVCTHAGCPVGLYEATTNLLLCPCHQSSFDVLRAAKPTGGPAVRPLPQLPLYADSEGILRAGGTFTAPPGPGFWGMP